jgi:XTP/dITP diphosphohydrolase
MTKKHLLVATGNAHKTLEIAAMLGTEWEVRDLRSHPQLISPEETGTTFEANARIKAEAASAELPDQWVLSDDSGLEVDILSGAPGVYSARYAGEGAGDDANRSHLKTQLADLAPDKANGWAARFCCCMALALDGKTQHVTSGAVEGRILPAEQGEGGFGYDALFAPDGHLDTFGLLPAETKNALSHRAKALTRMISYLNNWPPSRSI